MKYEGLTQEEVKSRINDGKYNYDTTTPSKSIKEIYKENIITLFNFLNIFLAISVLLVKSYKNVLFIGVAFFNTSISIIQEIRAKKVVDKLSVLSQSKSKVIRDGKEINIGINEIVLDDVIKYELGDQIVVDSVILEGEVEVNESFITGEEATIIKKKGDTVLSGSFIVGGTIICKVIHIGTDNYTSLISKDAKKIKTEISSDIVKSLNKIVKYVSIFLIPIGILLLLKQFSLEGNTTQNAVTSVVAALIAMIPEGLILLVSTVLAVSTIKLSRYNVLVQDLYSIETLARVDTLCLDKTGTITEGTMEVSDIIPLDGHSISELEEIIECLSTNLNDNNPTFKAINDKYKNNSSIKTRNIIPFSSERKYSAVILENEAYIMGALEFILKEEEFRKYKSKHEELSKNNRVIGVVKSTGKYKDVLKNNKEVIGFILIKDKIRKESYSLINYFNENEVDIKIISGDNPTTIFNIASEVGVNNPSVYDMSNLTRDTNLNSLVEEYNIFARVKPDQKRLLINALKNNGHVVAMTGDGVNDVLALKAADCGIAVASGSDAARNVSEIVLLDSNFDSVKRIIKEGRQTINNVQRSATLFLSKTIYASLLALLFLFINYQYPFEPIQMSLINTFTIGFPAFILALEPNHDRVNGKFLINVISKAIPSGLTTVVNILLLVLLAMLFKLSYEMTSTLAVIITIYTAILLIYRISKPLNLLRKSLIIFISLMYLIIMVTKVGRMVYSLELITPNAVLILIFLMYVSTRIFVMLSKLLNSFIEKRKRWFI